MSLYHHPKCPCASAFAQLPSVRAVCECEGLMKEEFKADEADQKCSSCGLWDGTHWHWCPENKRIEFKSAGAARKR